MTRPVDVMARAVERLRSPHPDHAQDAANNAAAIALHEYSAAVAELIEAAKMANGDHSAPHDCYATGPLTGDPVMDLVVCPGCRLAAALARVGGAK